MKRRVWDGLRRRWLVLTPEEGVRRRVLSMLVGMRIPATSIAQEYPVRINGMTQRADVVVFGGDGRPLMLVECKAPGVAVSEGVLAQAFRYNAVLGARYVMLTNGVDHYLYEVVADGAGAEQPPGRYIPLKEFPDLTA